MQATHFNPHQWKGVLRRDARSHIASEEPSSVRGTVALREDVLAELECCSATAQLRCSPSCSYWGSVSPAELRLLSASAPLLYFLASSNERVASGSNSHKSDLLGGRNPGLAASGPGRRQQAQKQSGLIQGILKGRAFQGRAFQGEDCWDFKS